MKALVKAVAVAGLGSGTGFGAVAVTNPSLPWLWHTGLVLLVVGFVAMLAWTREKVA